MPKPVTDLTMSGFVSFSHVGEPTTGIDYVRLVYRRTADLAATAATLRAEGWEVRSLSLGSGRIGKVGEWRKITSTDVEHAVAKFGAGRAFRHRGFAAQLTPPKETTT